MVKMNCVLIVVEWWCLGLMFVVIVVLYLVGWFIVMFLVEFVWFSLGGKVFGIGVGLMVYMLGLWYVFDVDYIVVIDNIICKLMSDGY